MKCQKVKKLLSASLDGELKDKQTLKIKQHLAHCSDCAGELKTLAQTWDIMDIWEDIEPSQAFTTKFWQKLAAQKPQRRLSPRLTRVLVPAIVAFLAITGLLLNLFIWKLPHKPTVEQAQTISLDLTCFQGIPEGSPADTLLSLPLEE